jgi:hypothetical protein
MVRSMTTGRAGIDAKFDRAERILDELEREVGAFLAAGLCEVAEEEEPDTGDLVYRIRVRQAPPVQWSVLSATPCTMPAARLTISHTVSSKSPGATPDETTYFPIGEAEKGYGDRMRKSLQGVLLPVRDAIRVLKPLARRG